MRAIGALTDNIERYYTEGGLLSPKELEMVQRYELVFSLFCEHRQRVTTIAKYIALMAQKGIDISTVTGYRDLATAEKLFAPLHKYQKEFLRQTIIDSALRDIEELEDRMGKLKRKKEHAQFVDLMRLKHLAETRIGKYSGLNSDDSNLPDFDKLQPHTFQIDLSQNGMRMLKVMMQSNNIDLTNLKVEDVDIIDDDDETD